jgi:hypothetical protein
MINLIASFIPRPIHCITLGMATGVAHGLLTKISIASCVLINHIILDRITTSWHMMLRCYHGTIFPYASPFPGRCLPVIKVYRSKDAMQPVRLRTTNKILLCFKHFHMVHDDQRTMFVRLRRIPDIFSNHIAIHDQML